MATARTGNVPLRWHNWSATLGLRYRTKQGHWTSFGVRPSCAEFAMRNIGQTDNEDQFFALTRLSAYLCSGA